MQFKNFPRLSPKSIHVYDGVIFEGVFTFILVLVFSIFSGCLKKKTILLSLVGHEMIVLQCTSQVFELICLLTTLCCICFLKSSSASYRSVMPPQKKAVSFCQAVLLPGVIPVRSCHKEC